MESSLFARRPRWLNAATFKDKASPVALTVPEYRQGIRYCQEDSSHPPLHSKPTFLGSRPTPAKERYLPSPGLSENRRPDPDHGGPFLYSHTVVIRHPHGKSRKMTTGNPPVIQTPGQCP